MTGKQAASIKNFEDTIVKMHDDLRQFYYNTKMQEYRTIKAIERLEETSDRKIKEIKDHYGIENHDDYDFDIPKATGRPGFLKKRSKINNLILRK